MRHATAPRLLQTSVPITPLIGDAVFAPIVLQRRKHHVASFCAVLDGVRADGVRQDARTIARADDVIIILSALAAEFDGHEQAARPCERLTFKRELPGRRWLKRGIHRASLADELMQLKRESTSTVVAKQFTASRQQFAQACAAHVECCARRFGQSGSGIRECARHTPTQATAFLRFDAELALGPTGERMLTKIRQGCRQRRGE